MTVPENKKFQVGMSIKCYTNGPHTSMDTKKDIFPVKNFSNINDELHKKYERALFICDIVSEHCIVGHLLFEKGGSVSKYRTTITNGELWRAGLYGVI